MFLHAAELDALYDETQGVLRFGVFDRRVLIPLDELPAWVERETGVAVPASRLDRIIDEGWLPALTTPDGGAGFPLYAPGRVGLLLQREARGCGGGSRPTFLGFPAASFSYHEYS